MKRCKTRKIYIIIKVVILTASILMAITTIHKTVIGSKPIETFEKVEEVVNEEIGESITEPAEDEKVEEPTPEPKSKVVKEDEKHYYDVALSHELQDWIEECLAYVGADIDKGCIIAMIYQESGFDPDCLGEAGDSGYCQLLQMYFEELYNETLKYCPELGKLIEYDIWNERTNIAVGIHFLNRCAKAITGENLSENNFSTALTAYNRGITGAKRYFENNGTYITPHSKAVQKWWKTLQETNKL